MACCHEIITEREGDKITYNACSPDDLCLVEFAKSKGYELLGIDSDGMLSIRRQILTDPFHIIQYKILNIIPFSSDRKRMSVVFQKLGTSKTEKIEVLVKGADSIILPRIINSSLEER